MTVPFVHLRLHTEFSLVDSTIRIKSLISNVAEMGMPAVAITDVCNFYGLIKFYTAAQNNGVKPLLGADFWVRGASDEDKPTLISLLAMNHEGYRNIILLISKAFQ
jgi:DNA polymerase-3 subunit alpha